MKRLLDLPYAYQADVILPRKRKSTIVNCIDFLPIEIDESNSEAVALDILPYGGQLFQRANNVHIYKKTDFGFINSYYYENNTINIPTLGLSQLVQNGRGFNIPSPTPHDTSDTEKCKKIIKAINMHRKEYETLMTEDEIGMARKILTSNKEEHIKNLIKVADSLFMTDGALHKKGGIMPHMALRNAPSHMKLNEYNIPFQIITPIVSRLDTKSSDVYIPLGYIDIMTEYAKLIQNKSITVGQQEMQTRTEHKNIIVINPELDLEEAFGKPENIIITSIDQALTDYNTELLMATTNSGTDFITIIRDIMENGYSDDKMELYYVLAENLSQELKKLTTEQDNIVPYMRVLQRIEDMKSMKQAINHFYTLQDKNELSNVFIPSDNGYTTMKKDIDFKALMSQENTLPAPQP